MKKVLCAGEINVDLVLQGYTEFPVPGKEVLVRDFAMVLGSATAIMAMGLARLGTPVAFAGRVGDDVWGRYCLDDMAGRGIDLSRVVTDRSLKTGVTVSITHPLDRALVTYLGAISALTGADVPDAAMAGLDHLHVSSFFFQEASDPTSPTCSPARTAPGSPPRSTPGSTRADSGTGACARRCARRTSSSRTRSSSRRSPAPLFPRRACDGSTTGGRASWRSWGRAGR